MLVGISNDRIAWNAALPSPPLVNPSLGVCLLTLRHPLVREMGSWKRMLFLLDL
jgi:hypothetical protein